jgi:glutamine synthetase adenylyltransferase
MPSYARKIALRAPYQHSFALTALLGAALLATPLTTAHAQTTEASAERKAETVEQRIVSLHAQLKITPDEEADWKDVAQTMRENAAKMEKLSAEKKANPSETMTAVEDLKTYEEFTHAHYDGLKNLIASFETLYTAMPDQQKHLADQVFHSFGHEGPHSRG